MVDFARLKARLTELIEDLRQKEDQLALVLSVVVGALVGLVVVAFILITGRLASHLFRPGGPDWSRMLIPAVGSLISGFLLVKYFPNARGSGIPQTRAAIFIHDGQISLRTVVGKFICCSISLASGISLGREGPSVQIGGGVASVLAQRAGLSKAQVKWLVPVGGSAALAAAFNTPIAAVLFSLEELTGDLHSPIIGSVVLSSATSWIVLHLILGDNPLFRVTQYRLLNPVELLIYAILGIAGGFVSVAFVKLLLDLRKRFARLPKKTLWAQPLVGGLTVGLMGFFVPQVLGVGYDEVERVLGGNVVLQAVLLLGVLKLIATAVCYASGNAGGIFGPTLFLGAMVGGVVGSIAHSLMPNLTAGPGAYALVGMGALFAGVVRTPMTSVIMIFEVTRDYSIIVPLMIANLLAYYVSHRLQKEPIYEALALQDGLHLPRHASSGGGSLRSVVLAIREAPGSLAPDMTVSEAANQVEGSSLSSWPVTDEDGLTGMVRIADIADASVSHPEWTLGELMRERATADHHLAHVHNDHPLSRALARMGETGHDVLPVVSRANARIVLGVVTLKDVLRAYGVEKSKRTAEFKTPVI